MPRGNLKIYEVVCQNTTGWVLTWGAPAEIIPIALGLYLNIFMQMSCHFIDFFKPNKKCPAVQKNLMM